VSFWPAAILRVAPTKTSTTVITMARRLLRAAGLVIGAGVGVWLGRLIAHSKVPPPEGKWREIPPDELA
jgi:ABC-type xylose transport system permease subunit